MNPTPPCRGSRRIDLIRLLFAGLIIMLSITPAAARAQEPEPPTDPSATTVTVEPAGDSEAVDQDAVDAENRRMIVIVAGLLAVAAALALLTIRYWRMTKPIARPATVEETARRQKPRRGPSSRQSVAGADHPDVDDDWEPRSTGEHIVTPDPELAHPERPSRSIRGVLFDREA